MEDLFNFSLKRQPSIQLSSVKQTEHTPKLQDSLEEEEIKENLDFCNEVQPTSQQNKKTSRKSFSSAIYHLNLSINVKKPRKRSCNEMVRSTITRLHSSGSGKRNILENAEQTCNQPILDLIHFNRRSEIRHESLTYSKRDKYVSNFDGKSLILSKIMRPTKANDSSLIFVESKFGRVELEPRSAQLKSKKLNKSPIDRTKSVFSGARKENRMMSEDGEQEVCLLIKKNSSEEQRKESASNNRENLTETEVI